MTFAHQLPRETSYLPRDRLPNRKWLPAELGGAGSTAAAELGSIAGTPVSDRLAAEQQQQADAASTSARSTTSVRSLSSSNASSLSSLRSAAAAERRAQREAGDSIAGDEQRADRRRRAEIARMRDEKLAAARAGQGAAGDASSSGTTPRRPSSAPAAKPAAMATLAHGQARASMVPLGQLQEGQVVRLSRTYKDEPLRRLGRVVSVRRLTSTSEEEEGAERGGGGENKPPSHTEAVNVSEEGGGLQRGGGGWQSCSREEVSLEYADLMSFVAGELRRR